MFVYPIANAKKALSEMNCLRQCHSVCTNHPYLKNLFEELARSWWILLENEFLGHKITPSLHFIWMTEMAPPMINVLFYVCGWEEEKEKKKEKENCHLLTKTLLTRWLWRGRKNWGDFFCSVVRRDIFLWDSVFTLWKPTQIYGHSGAELWPLCNDWHWGDFGVAEHYQIT